jgi:tripartite-type tricarboxylate transporter receptor subunit TctC
MTAFAFEPARRRLLPLTAAAVALAVLPVVAPVQAYPTRPVRLIVGQAAGSGSDIIARLMGQWLSDQLGQPFLIENRPGAAGNIAAEAVVRAPPDGHTLLLITSTNAVNAALYDNLNFNFIRDIAAVASIIRSPLVMEVSPSLAAKTVPELIAYAKANPGKLSMASAGSGSASHVAGELFKMMTGINMLHVPYRGSTPAVTGLLGGQVQLMFDALPSSIEHIKAGKLRALAVTTATRSQLLRDIPTVGESVPGYEASAWLGLGAPTNTPVDIVYKVNKEVTAALADPKIQSRLGDLGGTVLANSPADFSALIAGDTEKWAKVVKFSGAKPD